MKKFQLNLKSLFVVILVAGTVGFATYFILLLSQADPDKGPYVAPQSDGLFGWKYPIALFPDVGPVTEQIAYSDIRDPGGIPQGLPVRLKIPIIGVDSAIEDALITTDGRMDVPYGSVNVAWFALGPHPGQAGSAVIGGHFGINAGVKFVFYDLDKLKIGDKVYITNDKGETLAFQVRDIKLFDRNDDATTVFTSSDGLAHLNLITCEGIWNRVNDTYPQRRVVFTDAISAEGATEDSATIFRSLSLGARGTDVAELQTILVERGFLVIPSGISKGYFGTLTYTAVARYQASVGLPSNGIFDSTTRAKLIPATTVAGEPTSPSTTIFRSLGIGARGTDVAELQTILVERGFLVIPSGISKGYFGRLTSTAVAEYQLSIGLPATGVFDFTTRAKLIPATRVAIEPTLPSTAITPESELFYKFIISHAKSLYATPVDGLVTLTLLIAIAFIAFKIIKRKSIVE